MNIKPVAGKTTTRARQQTPRSLLDSLRTKPFFGGTNQFNRLARNLDNTLPTPRAGVDGAMTRANK
jgi:hypothetical protein